MSISRISANIQAMRALSSFNQVNDRLGMHQERLSTGRRINSTGDDPAGYQLAKKLEGRRRGLSVAMDNVANAQNVLSIAEGGYQNIMDILQTIKEKTLQAADGLPDSNARSALNDQVSALLAEIDDIVSETTLNGNVLINGSYSSSFQTGETASDQLAVALQDADSAALGINSISLSSQASASAAISTITTAITTLSQRTQDVGEYMLRLKSKERTLATAVSNTESIRSTIEDADFAKEQMEVLKLQIMQQTSISSLAQANSSPQSILSLFG